MNKDDQSDFRVYNDTELFGGADGESGMQEQKQEESEEFVYVDTIKRGGTRSRYNAEDVVLFSGRDQFN